MGSTSSTAGDDQDHDQDREAMDQDDAAMPLSQSSETQTSHSITIDDTATSSSNSTSASQSAAAVAHTGRSEIPTGGFMVPRREILTKEDLELFHGSATYAALFEFLDALNESIVGVVSTAECYQSEVQHFY